MKTFQKTLTACVFALVLSLPAWASDLRIQDPHVRAVPPTAEVTAAFMGLHNEGSRDLAIVDAHSPAARVVELHTHTQVEGVMQMRRIEKIEIPAGGTTELKPGGLHLMLIDLTAPLARDAQVEVTLTLDDGSLIELNMPVRQVQRPMHGQGRHGH